MAAGPRAFGIALAPGVALAAAIVLPPAAARAYLIDLNDARVVDPGTFEAELQPLGYYQVVLGGEEERTLVAPSMQIYFGLARDLDFLFLTRGFVALEAGPGQTAYSLEEQMLAFRIMLRHGRYSSETDGPSLTLQLGVLLPGIGGEPETGASVALLFAEEGDDGVLHLNAWVNLTRDRLLNLFFSTVVEGPTRWPMRPQLELWIDLVVGGEPTISGLAGLWIDLSDDAALEGGVRVGGWEGWAEVEARLSLWWRWRMWGSDDEDDGALQESARAMRRPSL